MPVRGSGPIVVTSTGGRSSAMGVASPTGPPAANSSLLYLGDVVRDVPVSSLGQRPQVGLPLLLPVCWAMSAPTFLEVVLAGRFLLPLAFFDSSPNRWRSLTRLVAFTIPVILQSPYVNPTSP